MTRNKKATILKGFLAKKKAQIGLKKVVEGQGEIS
jgi:hypothetical protein